MEGLLSLQDDPQKLAQLDTNGGLTSNSNSNGVGGCLELTPIASPRSNYHRKATFGLAVQNPSRSGKSSSRPEVAAPCDKFRRRLAKKEIIRRALMPPVKRPTLRWLDFRPTPSRLCNMSIV